MNEIEVLEAEYKKLLQEKLDAARKEKEAQELAALETKKKAEYEEEFRKKYNLTAISRLETPGEKTTNMVAAQKDHQQFCADFAKHKGVNVRGRPYSELMESLTYGKKGLLESA